MARPRKTGGDDGSEPKPARTRKTTSAKKTTASSSTSPKKTTTARKSTAKTATTASASRSEPTHDDIARRAYEISQGPDAGSDEDNWHRAVHELRGDSPDPGGPWAKLGSGDTDSISSD
jgi:hypothetical protein